MKIVTAGIHVGWVLAALRIAMIFEYVCGVEPAV